ncbi:metal-dependent phosphohydrolase [Lactococcus lactis]|uniref:Metal-dependent phosphohydrolase n=2 Tax=Lactococcus lactis TaxID=1358 RepID=A0A9X4NF05_9LACT|nr:metal-dependent phosphohydrolase [Lactococcus lactis]MDG4982860.1 metal-dependent phosphohydrolase [Lactococcus lactis]
MKKKMLLFVGLLAFFMPSALHTFADTGFTPPSTPDFSVPDKNNSKNDSKDTSKDDSKNKTDSSSNSSISDGTIKPSFGGGDLNDYTSPNSPSKVMEEEIAKKARANLDNYTSYMYYDDGKFLTGSMTAGMQTFFVRSQFFVTKTIYRFVNAVNEKLNSDSLITQWTAQMFVTVKNIYNQFSTPKLYPIIGIAIISSLLFYWLKRRFLEGLRKIVLVMILVGIFINGGQNLTDQVNGTLNDVTTTLVSTVKVAGVSSSSSNDLKTTMVEVPFLYLNFDGVKINADGTSNISEDNIVKVLASGDDNDTLKKIQSDLKDSHLTSKKLGEKVLTALASIFNAVLVGFIYLAFAVMAFVMRMLFLILLLLLPFVAILSLFPVFDVVILRWAKATGGALIVSNVVVIGTALISILDSIVSSAVTSMIGSDYFFITLVKFVVYIILFKKRQKILDIFKAGHLSNSGFAGRMDGLLSNVRRKGSNMIKAPLLAGSSAGLVAGLTAGQMATGKAKEIAKNRLTNGTGSLWHGGLNKKADRTMNKMDKANPNSKKGQKLQAKEEKIKQRLEKRKKRFENPNLLKRKVADYRKQYQQRKNPNDPSLAQKMEEKNKNKKDSIQALYDKNKTQLQARAIERRMREAVPDQEKPNLSELAKNKQKALAKEKLDERAMKQSASRTAERLKQSNLKGHSFASKPSYPWEKDNSHLQPNPFVINEK